MGYHWYTWVDEVSVRGVHLQCTVAAQLWAANPVWWDMGCTIGPDTGIYTVLH